MKFGTVEFFPTRYKTMWHVIIHRKGRGGCEHNLTVFKNRGKWRVEDCGRNGLFLTADECENLAAGLREIARK